MATLLGFEVAIPSIDITGFFSSSWIYVLIITFLGAIIITIIGLLLFFNTYNQKIEIYENISGRGYQKTLTTRARTIKLGISGEAVLKTLKGGRFLTAYGRKIGLRTYMFVKGEDGYLYNSIHGDFDTKMCMLDIEPIERDARMLHIALDRIHHADYDKKTFMEKYGSVMISFLFLIVLIIGMWVIIGKIGTVTELLNQGLERSGEIIENSCRGSGVVPA